MEQFNFYQVKVGIYSRKGNFSSINEFVCKSIMNKEKVITFYSKQYFGFSVLVSEISNIVELENTQPNNAKNIENEQLKIENERLKKETAEIKKSILNRSFKSSIHKSDLPTNLSELYSQMESKYKEYNNLKSKLRTDLRLVLKEKYKPFCKEISFDKDFSEDNYSCEYKVILTGELESLF